MMEAVTQYQKALCICEYHGFKAIWEVKVRKTLESCDKHRHWLQQWQYLMSIETLAIVVHEDLAVPQQFEPQVPEIHAVTGLMCLVYTVSIFCRTYNPLI